MSDVVKHLEGKHDQKEHGIWAREVAEQRAESAEAKQERQAEIERERRDEAVSVAIARFGRAAVERRGAVADPEFDGQVSSRSVFASQQPDGSWVYDDDRVALHEAYYAKRLAEATPVDSPIVVFLGGGSGAGKDYLLSEGVFKVPENHVESNPDLAKEFIPEYQNGKAMGDVAISFAVHEESSMLAKEVQRRAMEQGMNLVVNGTGDSAKVDEQTGKVDISKLAGKVAAARARGAQVVNGEYATISTEEAVRRARARSENRDSPSFGRVVPEKFIREIHEGISTAVPEILRTRLYDEFRLFDNTLRGEPRLVLEQKGGRVRVADEGLYRDFLMKSPLYADGEFRIIDGIPVPIEVSKQRVLYDLTRLV